MNDYIDSLDKAEKIIGPELASLILQSIQAGFQDYYDNVSDYSKTICSLTTKANFISDHMASRAKILMGGDPENVTFFKRSGRLHLLIKGQAEIKLKKLNKNRRPSNIQTGAVLAYNYQIPMSLPIQPALPNILSPITHLIAGYLANRLKTGIEAVYIVCPSGTENKWERRIDFTPQPVPVVPVVTIPNAPPENHKLVVPKKVKEGVV